MNRTSRFVGLSLLVVSFALVAPPASSAPPDASTARESEQLAAQGYQLYSAGKYAEAIAVYLKAYEISKAAPILYNVASIYDRKLHERVLAMEYYRRYLRAPDAEPDTIQKATARVTVLKRENESEEQARSAPVPPIAPSTPPVVAPPPPQPAPRAPETKEEPATTTPWKTVGIAVTAAGALSIGASVVLALLAKQRNDEANAICDGHTCPTARGVTLSHQAGGFATASTVSFIAGAALATTGITIVFAAPKSSTSAAVTVAPQNAAGLSLSFHGSF